MTLEKIGKLEAISLILIVTINEIVLNVPNIIILSSSTSSILNMIYVSILAIVFTFIICKLFKPFGSKDILDISEYLGGKFLKILVGILFILFFLIITGLSARYLSNNLKIIYFNNSPLVYLLLFFLVPAILLNKLSLKAISGVNLVFIFVVIISLLFLLISSSSNFDLHRIFPILGKGFYQTFIIGSTNIFAFSGLAYLYFMPSLLKDSKDFKKVSIISIILSAICLIFSIISILLTFPAAIRTDESLSIYLLTRMLKFGNFLERLDAIFIFAWFVSLLSFLSLNFFYILGIFKKITNIENIKALPSSLAFIVLAVSLTIKNYADIKFGGHYIYKYSLLFLVFVVGFMILVLANLKYKNKH